MKRSTKRGLYGTLGVILLLALIKFFQIRAAIAAGASRQMPPDAITSATVKEETWPIEVTAIGTLAPVNGAVLAAEELGRVDKILFEPGSDVKAGSVLVALDTSVEDAQLQSAQAQLDVATVDLNRAKSLRERGANSQSDFDNARATHRSAAAEVDRLKAVISRKKIVAPFDGTTGVRLVNPGEVIQPGTSVVSLQALDSLLLNFTVPQLDLGKITPGSKVHFTVDAFPKDEFAATISAVDPSVDEKTRNARVQATLTNTDHKLRPGMFVNLAVVLPEVEHVLSIPSSGVAYAPYGNSVFVVEKMKNPKDEEYLGVRSQLVKLGRHQGDMVAVVSGLTAGQEIASSGVFKLRPGSPVVVKNEVKPGEELHPAPSDT